MSKTLVRLFLVFAVFTLGAPIFAQDKPARPDPPDYTKAPFSLTDEGTGSPFGRPDLHGYAKVYGWDKKNDKGEPVEGEFVVVFSDKDNKLIYLSWANVQRKDNQGRFVLYGYEYKDSKWVYDKDSTVSGPTN